MKRIIALFFIMLMVMPQASAYVYTEESDGSLIVPVGGNIFTKAILENASKIDQTRIKDGNFTTNGTVCPYKDAYMITYRTDDGKTDFLITWQCDVEAYLDDYIFSDLTEFYSGYLSDNRTPVYMEIYGDYVYGIILDTENITYTEANLLYDILGKYSYATSDFVYPQVDASYPVDSHYNGPVIDPYETARNDPYAYYDYFDYEDNVDIDEYLYDQGYDE